MENQPAAPTSSAAISVFVKGSYGTLQQQLLVNDLIAAAELLKPSPALTDEARTLMINLWCKTLEEIGVARFDQALQLVMETTTFRPDIAEIRKAAGVNHGVVDPMEVAADAALICVIQSIRAYRKNSGTPHAGFDAPTEGALRSVGLGNVGAGLDRVGDLPVLLPPEAHRGADTFETGQFERTMTNFRREWREAYARASKESL